LRVSPKNNLKTLAYVVVAKDTKGAESWRPVIVLMRGDHQMNEAKFSGAIGGRDFRPMQEEEIVSLFRSPAGYLGPIGIDWAGADWAKNNKPVLLLDESLRGRKNMVGGANKQEYHYRNLSPDVNFSHSGYHDLRNVQEGEACPTCGAPLKLGKTVEIGHIFKLGYKYSESMGARVLDKDGKEVTPIMGSYGIGIERILTSCIEQNNDENGFWLPPSIAPFTVVVVPTNVKDEALSKASTEIAGSLEKLGYDVVIDDRDERPGVKFKDADLVGIPVRINVGKKLAEGKVEVVRRSTRETTEATIAEIPDVVARVVQAESV
jgi:prolyl-tRNA synthetase